MKAKHRGFFDGLVLCIHHRYLVWCMHVTQDLDEQSWRDFNVGARTPLFVIFASNMSRYRYQPQLSGEDRGS